MMLVTSHRRKELFDRCPEAFFHRYFNHYKELVSPELEMGNIVRQALNNLFNEMNIRGKPIKSTAKEVKSFTEDAIALLATPGLHSKSALNTLSPMVRFGLFGLNYEDYIAMSPNMSFEIPLTDEGHVLRGKVNLFLSRADGTVETIAFKTGASICAAGNDPLLASYALALREMGYPSDKIECKFKFLAHKTEDLTEFTDEYLDLLLEEYIEHVREVDRCLTIGRTAFPPTPSWYCKWCSYTGVCSVLTEEKPLIDSLGVENLQGIAAKVLVSESYLSRAKEILKRGVLKHGFVELNGEFFADWETTNTNYSAEEIYHLLSISGEDPFSVLSVDKQKLKRVMNGSLGYDIEALAKTVTAHSFGHKSERPTIEMKKVQEVEFLEKDTLQEKASSNAA